jgi:hypothetical protein
VQPSQDDLRLSGRIPGKHPRISLFSYRLQQLRAGMADTSAEAHIGWAKQVDDIGKAFRQIGDSNYKYLIPYLMLAAVYLVIVMVITWLIRLLERRLKKVDRNQ